MFEGISSLGTFSKVKEIEKGMSGDRKYYIETRDGKKLLLRITDISNYETKKKDIGFASILPMESIDSATAYSEYAVVSTTATLLLFNNLIISIPEISGI